MLWTYGLPIALMLVLRRWVYRVPFPEIRIPLWAIVSGVGGALGLRVLPGRPAVGGAILRWALAWLLCATGLFGILAFFVSMRGAPLLVVVAIALVSLPVRLARRKWRGEALPPCGAVVWSAFSGVWRETGLHGIREVTYGLLLPITAQRLLRWGWRKLAGESGYSAGHGLATAFLGPISLWLAERPVPWAWRIPLVLLALPIAAAGVVVQVWQGWWILLLVPLLRQIRWMKAAPWWPQQDALQARPPGITIAPFDRVALAIMGTLLVLLILASPRLKPFAPDAYYHLLVAREIVETGAVPLWDWWEYAPLGRPHLYAPFLHLLIALFSLPFGGDVVLGLRVLQVLMLPTALFATWYAVRWIYDARIALLTMLILGTDLMFALLGYMALPSILANVLLCPLLLMILRRRTVPAIALLGIMLYTHPGVGGLTVLSLVVFGLWERDYRGFMLVVIPAGVLIALPWYGHVWAWRDWMGHPMRGVVSGPEGWLFKLFWLMNLNLFIMVLAFCGLRLVRWADTSTRLVASLLIGFLPMLISYGGRYFAHTMQWWALFAAVPVAPLLLRSDRRPIMAAILFIAFLAPVVLLSGFGEAGGKPGYQPMVSGFILAPVFVLSGTEKSDPNAFANPGLLEAATYIRENTRPETILHVGEDASLGVMLAYHAHRRIDTAAWPEVRQPHYTKVLTHYTQHDSARCHVARNAEGIPKGLDAVEVGGYFIGVAQAARQTPTRDTSPQGT